jgi:predicted Co/Zn/Cd cation transporter (cation efflux family)
MTHLQPATLPINGNLFINVTNMSAEDALMQMFRGGLVAPDMSMAYQMLGVCDRLQSRPEIHKRKNAQARRRLRAYKQLIVGGVRQMHHQVMMSGTQGDSAAFIQDQNNKDAALLRELQDDGVLAE